MVQSSQTHGNEMIDHIINIIEVSRAFKSIRMDRVYLKLGVGKAQFTLNAITYTVNLNAIIINSLSKRMILTTLM